MFRLPEPVVFQNSHTQTLQTEIFLNKFNLLIEIGLRFFIFHIHLHCSIKNVIKMQAHAAHTKLEKQLCFLHCLALEKRHPRQSEQLASPIWCAHHHK